MDTQIRWVREGWQGIALELREVLSFLPQKQIHELFQASSYQLKQEHLKKEFQLREVMGVRKATAHVWLERINWADDALQDLTSLLVRAERKLKGIYSNPGESRMDGIRAEFALLGFNVDENWVISKRSDTSDAFLLEYSPVGVKLELDRLIKLVSDIDTDAVALLGKCKDLVEAACKTVIIGFGEKYEDDSFPALSKQALKLLGLDLKNSDLPEHQQALVGGMRAAVQAVNDIRNKTKGAGGHGTELPEVDFDSNFARFVADSSIALVRFMMARLIARSQYSE